MMLARIPDMKDAFADAIFGGLQYHIAVALRNDEDAARLERSWRL